MSYCKKTTEQSPFFEPKENKWPATKIAMVASTAIIITGVALMIILGVLAKYGINLPAPSSGPIISGLHRAATSLQQAGSSLIKFFENHVPRWSLAVAPISLGVVTLLGLGLYFRNERKKRLERVLQANAEVV